MACAVIELYPLGVESVMTVTLSQPVPVLHPESRIMMLAIRLVILLDPASAGVALNCRTLLMSSTARTTYTIRFQFMITSHLSVTSVLIAHGARQEVTFCYNAAEGYDFLRS